MVFGYYTVGVERYSSTQVAHLFQIAPHEYVEKAVKLGHFMYIPFFPIEKMWVLNKGGERFKIKYEVAQQLERQFGALRAPWYAFAGLILVGVLYVGYSISGSIAQNKWTSQRQTEAQNLLAQRMAWVNEPTAHDYYTLKRNYESFVVKVNGFTRDSIEFLVSDPIRTLNSNEKKDYLVAYLNEPDSAAVRKKLAKVDIEKFFASEADWNTATNDVDHSIWGRLADENTKFETVERFHADSVARWVDNNRQAVDVKAAFSQYLANINNIGATLPLLDTASTAFFKRMLETAVTDDIDQMKAFVDKSSAPLVTLKLMLYTQYVYLDGIRMKPGQHLTAQTLEDYMFMLKLVEQGLWTIATDTELAPSLPIQDITFVGEDKAVLRVSKYSNILKEPNNIPFDVVFHKEGGAWKINVPSTFHYTNLQIQLATQPGTGTMNKQAYKKMVIDEVNQFLGGESKDGKKREVALEWLL